MQQARIGELARDAWPHEVYARAGGHALTDDDIDAALTFFVRIQHEKVPLSPPLSAHRPQPHARDAAPPGAIASDAEPEDEGALVDGGDESDATR